MNKEMLNTKEVASYLNINEKQVYRLISELKSLGIDPGAINPPNRRYPAGGNQISGIQNKSRTTGRL